ncbi:MAG: hypothetical protein M3R05_00045 [Chloroflexota bacterium]|nr:hypothetical protein [Chloroflexota bacterium]
MADMFNAAGMMGKRRGGPMALLRRLIVLGFAVVQLILVARILIDLDVLPGEGTLPDLVISLSEAVAAPVAKMAQGFGGGFGSPVSGADPAIIAALIGWTVVEGLVVGVLSRFSSV